MWGKESNQNKRATAVAGPIANCCSLIALMAIGSGTIGFTVDNQLGMAASPRPRALVKAHQAHNQQIKEDLAQMGTK